MSEANKPEHLESAYDRMMERVHDAIKRAGDSDSLHKYLEDAREKAVELGELTREEADKVATYLQRDLRDAGAFLSSGDSELGQWLRFDLQQIEDRLWEVFSRVADQTRLEWELFRRETQEPDAEPIFYHTSEVTGPGTLECVACNKLVHFRRVSHIPPCPACHKTEFRRVSDDRCASDHQTR